MAIKYINKWLFNKDRYVRNVRVKGARLLSQEMIRDTDGKTIIDDSNGLLSIKTLSIEDDFHTYCLFLTVYEIYISDI